MPAPKELGAGAGTHDADKEAVADVDIHGADDNRLIPW
jgi:hypothetical protein